MRSWRRRQSGHTGQLVCCLHSSPGKASASPAACQTRTAVSCGTAARWSVDPSRTPPMTCAAWSRRLQCRPCLSCKTSLCRPHLSGSASRTPPGHPLGLSAAFDTVAASLAMMLVHSHFLETHAWPDLPNCRPAYPHRQSQDHTLAQLCLIRPYTQIAQYCALLHFLNQLSLYDIIFMSSREDSRLQHQQV